RRFASGEVTQAEPEADGATEAQHGENSIAASSNGQPTEPATDSASQQTSAQETLDSADHESQSVASAISSAAGTVSNKVSEATETAAQAVGASTDYMKRSAANAAHAAGVGSSSDEVDGKTSTTPKTVYVGNLFFDVSEDSIRQAMQRFGTVNNVKIIYDGRGLSKGFGYVEFANDASAAKAIEEMNQQVFEGRRMIVQYSIQKTQTRAPIHKAGPTNTLFIGNMSFEMSDQDLNDLFRDIRDVVDVRVAIDRRTGQPRGFAHAEFVDVASAEKAMKQLENKETYGRKLRIDFSKASEPRTTGVQVR
ncbi:MAG: hypothetical protein Q9187_007527, partial [Circinaria calcarea]